MDALHDKDSVLQAHAQNHAIAALVAVKPSCITNARFDRGELTLWISATTYAPCAAPCKRRDTISWPTSPVWTGIPASRVFR